MIQPPPLPPACLPLPRVLYVLFFQPAGLFFLQQTSWRRAFRLFALISLLCGAVIAGVRVPRTLHSLRGWSRWFGTNVEAVWVEKGKLHWARPAKLPTTLYRSGWRFDFALPDAPIPLPEQLGPAPQGLWITSEAVHYWRRADSAGRTVQQVLFENGMLLGRLPLADDGPGTAKLTSVAFENAVGRSAWRWLAFYVAFGSIQVFLEGLCYTVLFAFIPFLMRSPIVGGGFIRLLTLYTYAAVPAMIVASVYATLDLPFLNHALVFVIGLVVYLSVATRAASRAAGPRDET